MTASDAGAPVPEAALARVGWVQVDWVDLDRSARFWSALLGVEIDAGATPPAYRCLRALPGSGLVICFQRVPEPKTVKNRLHLDLQVSDMEAATARIEELGGRRQQPRADYAEDGWSWRVMIDPEGNEFCLVP